MKFLFKLWGVMLDILFPPLCLSCKRHLKEKVGVLCDACYQSIPIATAFLCGGCKKRLPAINGKILACKCGDSIILGAASTYAKGALNELITALKYRGITEAAKPLGQLLARFIIETKLDFSSFIIIPVPLSSSRMRDRGYNQAELIAQEFLRLIPEAPQKIHTDILKRAVNAKPQTSMSSRDLRKKNIIGAFAVNDPAAVQGKSVLIIDDVYTSGSTAKEAVKTLKLAGARRVVILTAARA